MKTLEAMIFALLIIGLLGLGYLLYGLKTENAALKIQNQALSVRASDMEKQLDEWIHEQNEARRLSGRSGQ